MGEGSTMSDARQSVYPDGRPHAPDVETLRQVAVLSYLDDSALGKLAPDCVCRCYPKGQRLDRSDAEDGAMLAVICGGLCAGFQSGGGNLLPAFWLASGEVFEFGQSVPADIDDAVLQVTVQGTVVCCIPREPWTDAVAAPPECRRWIDELVHERDELRALVSDQLYPVPKRIRRILWRKMRDGAERTGVYTHAQIAAMSRTVQRRVTEVVGELASQGVIKADSREHRITVLDSEELISQG